MFISFVGYIAWTSYRLISTHRRPNAVDRLRPQSFYALSPYTEQHRSGRWLQTFGIVVVGGVWKAIFASFAKASGTAQVVAFLLADLAAFISILVLRPGNTRGADVLEGFIALIRLITTGCLIAFIQTVNVKPIPRVGVGIGMALFESVAIIVLFLNIVWNLVTLTVACIRHRHRPEPTFEAKEVPVQEDVGPSVPWKEMDVEKALSPVSEEEEAYPYIVSDPEHHDSLELNASSSDTHWHPGHGASLSEASTVVNTPRASTTKLISAASAEDRPLPSLPPLPPPPSSFPSHLR